MPLCSLVSWQSKAPRQQGGTPSVEGPGPPGAQVHPPGLAAPLSTRRGGLPGGEPPSLASLLLSYGFGVGELLAVAASRVPGGHVLPWSFPSLCPPAHGHPHPLGGGPLGDAGSAHQMPQLPGRGGGGLLQRILRPSWFFFFSFSFSSPITKLLETKNANKKLPAASWESGR